MPTLYWVNHKGETDHISHAELLEAARAYHCRPITLIRWWASIPLSWVIA